MEVERYTHQPVMLEEALAGLNIKEDGCYVDGTFGRGGHSRGILACLGTRGALLAFDKDPQALSAANDLMTDGRFAIRRGSFANLRKEADANGWLGKVDGILLDLGVSSPQLDDASRGFSFRDQGPLDMRMDPEHGVSAAQWLAQAKDTEIADVLSEYGEERFAKRIARAIVNARQESPIDTTQRLQAIVAAANPSWEKGKDPATRSFQAIRIFINQELEDLKTCLSAAVEVLAPGGRLVVISFHSLEDRIVKRFIREQTRGDELPPDLPIRHIEITPKMLMIGKAVMPSEAEVNRNPRARSAVLRIAERTAIK